ncbi:MAG: calcium-binding EGF-like domain-containing protein [Deltaproteobacteria bacterium]|nr:calcium-binding EGF-like domain-containing protein [Deltaproteobacteria bacterium]
MNSRKCLEAPKVSGPCWWIFLVVVVYPTAAFAEDTDPCADVDCSSHGVCTIKNDMPSCSCDEGYRADLETGQNCEPTHSTPGWSRGAAISGLVSVPVVALLGAAASTHWAVDGALFMQASDLSLILVMGQVITAGARSAGRPALVPGAMGSRIAAHVLYSSSLFAGSISTIFNGFYFITSWVIQSWTGVGALSLLLYSVDAAATYRQAAVLHAEDSKPVLNTSKRSWTWVAFGMGGAATVGAVVTGSLALSKKASLDKKCKEADEGDIIGIRKVTGRVAGALFCEKSSKDEINRMANLASITDILIVAAATGLAVGTALYFIEPKLGSGIEDDTLSLMPFAVPGGAGLMLGRRF